MWVLYALLSAAIWGFDYLIAEKVLEKISISTLMLLQLITGVIVIGIYSLFSGTLVKDLGIISHSTQLKTYLIWAIGAFLVADFFIFLAIQEKNATLATLIEISYPLFVILFGWLIYKQNHLTPSVIIGGIFVFLGIFIIYRFNH